MRAWQVWTLTAVAAAATGRMAQAQQPIGRTSAHEVKVSGAVDVHSGEMLLGNGSAITAGEQAVQIAERSEASQYQRDTVSEIINAQLDREKFSGQMLELMAKLPREQDVYLAIVRWGGESIERLGP